MNKTKKNSRHLANTSRQLESQLTKMSPRATII